MFAIGDQRGELGERVLGAIPSEVETTNRSEYVPRGRRALTRSAEEGWPCGAGGPPVQIGSGVKQNPAAVGGGQKPRTARAGRSSVP